MSSDETTLPPDLPPVAPPRPRKKDSITLAEWDEMYRMGNPPWDIGRPSAEFVRVIEQGPIRPSRALELGCGTGANAVHLALRKYEVTAIDASPLAIERARLRCEQHNALIRFVRGDLFEFAKNAGRFEFVYDVGFYHFVRRFALERFLDLLWWVTEPGSYYLTLAGASGETAEGGPPQVSEDEIRWELGRLFEMVDLRPFRFESPNRSEGFLGWSCLMRRPVVNRA